MTQWIIILLLLVVVIISITIAMKRQTAAFKEKFPPISDAEFLARCEPSTDPEIALKVRRIIADYLAVEYERIYPSSRLMQDLGAE